MQSISDRCTSVFNVFFFLFLNQLHNPVLCAQFIQAVFTLGVFIFNPQRMFVMLSERNQLLLKGADAAGGFFLVTVELPQSPDQSDHKPRGKTEKNKRVLVKELVNESLLISCLQSYSEDKPPPHPQSYADPSFV